MSSTHSRFSSPACNGPVYLWEVLSLYTLHVQRHWNIITIYLSLAQHPSFFRKSSCVLMPSPQITPSGLPPLNLLSNSSRCAETTGDSFISYRTRVRTLFSTSSGLPCSSWASTGAAAPQSGLVFFLALPRPLPLETSFPCSPTSPDAL